MIAALWQRELVRFYRDRSRVIGAFAPPVVFWFLIGSGLSSAFTIGGQSYFQYFFSGTLVLIVLFTSIFSTISIIEDRREGFLQSVLVAPAPRWRLVLGKILGASTVGLLQGLLFLGLAFSVGLEVDAPRAVVGIAFASLALTGLGFWIAWRLDSTQGFHGVMNLFLIPMWLLSGSLFPAATAPPWLRAVIAANPVTYAVAALQWSLAPERAAEAALTPYPVCLAVLALFSALTLGLSLFAARD